ncbi:HD-GYP domain-containing protein [Paenisporosarcina macmurdoensis]|uniref:HD-GYP domain-containing protein n=1 Tax=Paenisporosarcina macmurdoensis TaxID=212659 RepID=A0ABW1LAP2_9BACL
MRGFKIGKKGSSLERVKFNNNDISLLTRGDGTEVLLQSIEKDKLFYIYPSDNPEVMEFYLILSGEVVCEVDNQKVFLGPQDYFSAKGLLGPIHFTTLSNVTLLWVTTEPIFDSVRNQISSLMDIVKKVELKDNYTYRHSDRVANNAVKIAKKLNLNTDQVHNINTASFLHDIGKINIPEDILNKPSFLTEEEFSIVKKHPVDGVEIVKGSNYEGITPIIEQHHERLNGSGYPYGLIGDQILLESRIIAVSDSFDAMTEDRPYRKAFEPQFALNEIKKLVGTHYDKQVVEAFEEVLKDDGKIPHIS